MTFRKRQIKEKYHFDYMYIKEQNVPNHIINRKIEMAGELVAFWTKKACTLSGCWIGHGDLNEAVVMISASSFETIFGV